MQYRQFRALYLKQMWSELYAPTVNSCWCMRWNYVEKRRTTTYIVKLYNHFKGSIPEGVELHHKCNNKWCVNPKHIELLTFEEHLKAHGKKQRVSFRAKNKYQRLIRELVENKTKFRE